jgi:hypothetical protein
LSFDTGILLLVCIPFGRYSRSLEIKEKSPTRPRTRWLREVLRETKGIERKLSRNIKPNTVGRKKRLEKFRLC